MDDPESEKSLTFLAEMDCKRITGQYRIGMIRQVIPGIMWFAHPVRWVLVRREHSYKILSA